MHYSPFYLTVNLLYVYKPIMSLGMSKKMEGDCKWMGYMNFWSMLIVLIHWAKKEETGLHTIAEKTKYMFMSCHQNIWNNPNIREDNKSPQDVSGFTYLTTTKQNYIHERIEGKLNSQNSCYSSIQQTVLSPAI